MDPQWMLFFNREIQRPSRRPMFIRSSTKNRIYMDSEGELLIFIGRCSQKERDREIVRERERENCKGSMEEYKHGTSALNPTRMTKSFAPYTLDIVDMLCTEARITD